MKSIFAFALVLIAAGFVAGCSGNNETSGAVSPADAAKHKQMKADKG